MSTALHGTCLRPTGLHVRMGRAFSRTSTFCLLTRSLPPPLHRGHARHRASTAP